MHRLYEVCAVVLLAASSEFLPKAAFIDWDIPDDEKSVYLPVMKSDITLQSGDRRLIIDTKYYSRTMQFNALYDAGLYLKQHLSGLHLRQE